MPTVDETVIKISADTSELESETQKGGRLIDKFIRDTQRRASMLNRIKMSPTVRLNDKISEPLRKIETNLIRLGKTAKSITITAVDRTSGVLRRVSRAFTSLPGLIGLGAVTLGPAALLGNMINTAGDFQQAMANVASVAGASREELDRLTQAALEMGKTTQFKASEAADALYYLASAGFTVDQQISALSGTLSLAAATQADLAFTSETVAATLSAFGMEAGETNRVANVFAATISKSQATMSKLADSMRYAGPIAGSFGMSIESTSAALGALYNAGLRGEQAGTTLRAALTALANPAGQTKDAMAKLGLTADQINPALHSIADIIETLEKRGIDTAMAMQLFGTEAGSGMMAMIKKGSSALRQLEKDITGTNKAAEMMDIQMDTLNGSIKYLQSAWESISITLGMRSIPGLRRLVGYLKDSIDNSEGLANIVGDRLNRVFNYFADILEDPGFKQADWGGKIGILLDKSIEIVAPKAAEIGLKIGAEMAKGLVSGIEKVVAENPLLAFFLGGLIASKVPGPPVIKLVVAFGTGLGLYAKAQGQPHEGERVLTPEEAYGMAIEGNAYGNIITRPTLSMVGERGPEAIIPLSSRMRSRALELFHKPAGTWALNSMKLGVLRGLCLHLPELEGRL